MKAPKEDDVAEEGEDAEFKPEPDPVLGLVGDFGLEVIEDCRDAKLAVGGGDGIPPDPDPDPVFFETQLAIPNPVLLPFFTALALPCDESAVTPLPLELDPVSSPHGFLPTLLTGLLGGGVGRDDSRGGKETGFTGFEGGPWPSEPEGAAHGLSRYWSFCSV